MLWQRVKNNLQTKPSFWKARRFFSEKVFFSFFKHIYRIRFNYREEKISSNILKRTLTSLLLNIIYAVFFVAVFEFLYKISPYKIPFQITENEVGLLISTIIIVSGVFLGLYFTAISAIAGNLFMRATEDLQNLFIRERKGRQYIRTLVLTTVIGIFYLLVRAFSYSISPLGPIVITLLALYSVIRFMTLGSQTFYFIHPIEASATITGDAAYSIQNATVNGFGWDKSFLQSHYKKQAERALNTLNSLISFGIDVIKLSEEQLVTIARYAGGLLDYYFDEKDKIPTESHWYKRKFQFQNWIFADSSELMLALNTGTSLSPKSIKDRTWFEKECIDIILRLFNYFIKKRQWESAHVCIEILVSVTEKIGSDFYDDIGGLVIAKVQDAIEKSAISLNPTNKEGEKGQLALIDGLGMLGIAALLGLLRYVDKRDSEKVVLEIKAIDWTKDNSIYLSDLPGKMLSSLESTAREYKTERIIEKRRISPEWYLITITVQQYLFEIKKYYEFIKTLHQDLFQKNVERLIKEKKFLPAAHLIERWLEFTNKLSVCGWRLQKLIEDCAKLKKVKDLSWVEIDFSKEKKLVESFDKRAVDKLIYLLPMLTQLPETDLQDLPDHFGQAYTFGVEACYQACHDNDTERFKKIFPAVFLGALSAHDSTRKNVQGWAQDSQIIFSSEPLEDLLSLSGFAKLYSELYENAELWETCENAWNNYLDNTNAKDVIGFLVETAKYRDSKFMIMPKAMLRSNWDINFRRKLVEMNLISDPLEDHLSRRDRSINHTSPIIRVIGRYGDLLPADPRNIFFITYLSKHPSAQDTEFSDRRDLEQRIEEETASTENNQQEHDEDSE